MKTCLKKDNGDSLLKLNSGCYASYLLSVDRKNWLSLVSCHIMKFVLVHTGRVTGNDLGQPAKQPMEDQLLNKDKVPPSVYSVPRRIF